MFPNSQMPPMVGRGLLSMGGAFKPGVNPYAGMHPNNAPASAAGIAQKAQKLQGAQGTPMPAGVQAGANPAVDSQTMPKMAMQGMPAPAQAPGQPPLAPLGSDVPSVGGGMLPSQEEMSGAAQMPPLPMGGIDPSMMGGMDPTLMGAGGPGGQMPQSMAQPETLPGATGQLPDAQTDTRLLEQMMVDEQSEAPQDDLAFAREVTASAVNWAERTYRMLERRGEAGRVPISFTLKKSASPTESVMQTRKIGDKLPLAIKLKGTLHGESAFDIRQFSRSDTDHGKYELPPNIVKAAFVQMTPFAQGFFKQALRQNLSLAQIENAVERAATLITKQAHAELVDGFEKFANPVGSFLGWAGSKLLPKAAPIGANFWKGTAQPLRTLAHAPKAPLSSVAKYHAGRAATATGTRGPVAGAQGLMTAIKSAPVAHRLGGAAVGGVGGAMTAPEGAGWGETLARGAAGAATGGFAGGLLGKVPGLYNRMLPAGTAGRAVASGIGQGALGGIGGNYLGGAADSMLGAAGYDTRGALATAGTMLGGGRGFFRGLSKAGPAAQLPGQAMMNAMRGAAQKPVGWGQRAVNFAKADPTTAAGLGLGMGTAAINVGGTAVANNAMGKGVALLQQAADNPAMLEHPEVKKLVAPIQAQIGKSFVQDLGFESLEEAKGFVTQARGMMSQGGGMPQQLMGYLDKALGMFIGPETLGQMHPMQKIGLILGALGVLGGVAGGSSNATGLGSLALLGSLAPTLMGYKHNPEPNPWHQPVPSAAYGGAGATNPAATTTPADQASLEAAFGYNQ